MEQKYLEKNNFSEQKDFSEEDRYLRAKKRVKQIEGFYWHFFWYMVVNIFILVMIYRGNKENFWQFGHFSTAFFWGIGLVAYWAGVFGKHIIFSKDWEERKIREYMDKDKFDI